MTMDQPRSNDHEYRASSPALQEVLDTGNFDGIGVIFDYMQFEERHFQRLMRGVGDVLQKVEQDEQIKKIVEETGNEQHFRVQVRKREIALEVLLPLISELPKLTFPDDADSKNDLRRKINLVYTAMYLATGEGSKAWPIPFQDLLDMEGNRRVVEIMHAFREDKYRTIYEGYRGASGQLSREQFEKVQEYIPSVEEVETARQRLLSVASKMFNTVEMVDTQLARAAAKILGVMEPESDNYLLAESMIFVGRP